MIRSIAVAIVCVLVVCSVPPTWAQSADSLALRTAHARSTLGPPFEEGMRAALKQTRDQLPVERVAPEEASEMLSAYDRELDLLIDDYVGRFAAIMARHLSMEQIRSDADPTSPEWKAAMAEVMAMVNQVAVRDGMALAMRVIKTGCTVRPRPTEVCADMLKRLEELRASGVVPG